MKASIVTALFLTLGLTASLAQADKVHDWRDLDKVHEHIKQAIEEMNRARAANHYDMDGHGAKAESLMHQTEEELKLAIESAKHAH